MDPAIENRKAVAGRVKTGLTIALLLLNFFFLYKFFEYRSAKDNLELRMARMEGDLEETVAKLAKSKQQSEELNKLLRQTYEEIEQLKKDLGFRSQAAGEEQRIRRFLEATERYLSKIDSLVRENQVLLAENRELKEKIEVEQGISSRLRTEKQELQIKLGDNSGLTAENIMIAGIKLTPDNIEVVTHQLSAMSKIKLCFDLVGKLHGSDERIPVYVQLISPAGKVISDPKMPAGTFMAGGIQMEYTMKAMILRNERGKNFCLYSDKSGQVVAGDYRAAIYCEGSEIGTQKLVLY